MATNGKRPLSTYEDDDLYIDMDRDYPDIDDDEDGELEDDRRRTSTPYHEPQGFTYGMGMAIVFAVMGAIGLTMCTTGKDAHNVSRDEARVFLNAQTDFVTYELGAEVLCYENKYDEGWGTVFTGTRADGTTFQEIVCAKAIYVVEGPNQADDPLDVRSNRESLFIPQSSYYRVRLPG